MRQTQINVSWWYKPSYMFRYSTSHQQAVYKKTGRYTQPDGGLLKAQTCTYTWVLYHWNTSWVYTNTVDGVYWFRKVLSALSVMIRLPPERPRQRSCLGGKAICAILETCRIIPCGILASDVYHPLQHLVTLQLPQSITLTRSSDYFTKQYQLVCLFNGDRAFPGW